MLNMKNSKFSTLIKLIIASLWNLLTLSTAFASAPSVEAIAQVYGDGEHVSAVVLNYDKTISPDAVTADKFSVPGRKISNVYVTNLPEPNNNHAESGNYIIIELSQPPMSDKSIVPHSADDIAQRRAMGKTGPELGSHGNPQPLPECNIQVQQLKDIQATDGSICPAFPLTVSTKTRELVVEDFIQKTYTDSKQNNSQLEYNLFIPKNYDAAQKYSLVLFMHDAGTVSPEVKATLVQGRGAIVWAEPSWQEKHPCFVLAPQYDTIIVDDNYDYGPELDCTMHLLQELTEEYSIDTSRIYNTGQSMGGMTTIAMDVKYPDFFAASYPVACKWNSAVTSPLGQQNIWVVSSEGDPGAESSLKEIFGSLEKEGSFVKYLTMDLSLPADDINNAITALIEPNCHLYYTNYTNGTHRSTWQHAYDMYPALEWIFAQQK